MVQTYDPWGLGSSQSERTTQIAGGIGHNLVGTWLSRVNRVLFENIFWEGIFENMCMSCLKG